MSWGQKIKPAILLNQNEVSNFDSHVIVRATMVKRETVARLEDEVGGKLIPDGKSDLLRVLDELAELVRNNNAGRYPRERTIEFMSERYVHRDLILSQDIFLFQWGVNFKLGDVRVAGTKKMWFRKPISIQVNRSQKGAILLP